MYVKISEYGEIFGRTVHVYFHNESPPQNPRYHSAVMLNHKSVIGGEDIYFLWTTISTFQRWTLVFYIREGDSPFCS